MDVYDISRMAITLFVIVLVVFIVVFGLFMIVKHSDETKVKAEQAKNDIRKFRVKRYENIKQVLQVFGNGNPHAPQLEKLRALYTKVNSEEREFAWEEKYVSVMHSFMDYAGDHVSPQLQASYDMANNALIANEQALDGARDEYQIARKTLDLYGSVPLKYVIMVGEKLMSFTRKANNASVDFNDKLQDRLAEHEAQKQAEAEAMETIDQIIELEKQQRMAQRRQERQGSDGEEA